MGQALQVELEDAESRMRTFTIDRHPEILFPGRISVKNPHFGVYELQVAESSRQESANICNFTMFVLLSRDQPDMYMLFKRFLPCFLWWKAEIFSRNFGTWTIGSHEVRDASFMHQAGLIRVSPIPKFTKTKRRKRKHETPGNVEADVFFFRRSIYWLHSC